MHNSLALIGLIALIIGCACFGLIGFKRSAWWGPWKSDFEELDLTEKRFAIVDLILLIIGIVFLVLAIAVI